MSYLPRKEVRLYWGISWLNISHFYCISKIKDVPRFSSKGRKVIGAVGGIVIEEGSDKYAYKQGLYVITESGETVRILNDEKFKPKKW